jgi:hypothetical protein
MKTKWLLLLPVRIAIGVVCVFLAWQAIVFMRPRPRPLTVAEVKAVRAACEKVADLCAKQVAKPARIGVAHLANDPRDVATTMLRDVLSSRAGFQVLQESPVQKFLRDVGRAVTEASSLDEVINAGRRVELDVIVAGKLLAADSTNGVAQAALQVYAYDVRPAQWLIRDVVTAEYDPSLPERAWDWCKGTRPLTRFVGWVLAVLLMPWATLFATRWALEKKNNTASFIIVSSYTVLAMALAVGLAGAPGGTAYWLKMFAAFVFAAAYSFWACEQIAKREE